MPKPKQPTLGQRAAPKAAQSMLGGAGKAAQTIGLLGTMFGLPAQVRLNELSAGTQRARPEVPIPDGKGGYHVLRQPLGQVWLSHRNRRQYRGIVFVPGGEGVISRCLNIWQGWGVMPKAGDWSLIRAHIEEVIAAGNVEYADYVMRWIAWSIQNPAAPAEVALVLIGEKGVGKGTLVRLLERIFGAHAFQVTSREEVIGKFNGHLENCVLFVADEAYWGGDKRCVGRLQGLITEPRLPIERKGFDLIWVPNYLHVVMLAEPGWVIPAAGKLGGQE